MKKLILLLSVVVLLISCETKNAEIKSTDIIIDGEPIKTYIIDSCEYIKGFQWGSHKGNCSFCEKRRTQEIETIKNDF